MQELNEVIGIKLLISVFKKFWFLVQISRGGKCPFCSPADAHGRQVQSNIRPLEALLRKNVYLFLERWKKSNNTWLRALMQSDCLYSSFEHYNRYLLCD